MNKKLINPPKLIAMLLVMSVFMSTMVLPVSAHSGNNNANPYSLMPFTNPGGCHAFSFPRQSSPYVVQFCDQTGSTVYQQISVPSGSGQYTMHINYAVSAAGTYRIIHNAPQNLTYSWTDCAAGLSFSSAEIIAYDSSTGNGIYISNIHHNISTLTATLNQAEIDYIRYNGYDAYQLDLGLMITGHNIMELEVLVDGSSYGYLISGNPGNYNLDNYPHPLIFSVPISTTNIQIRMRLAGNITKYAYVYIN